MTEYEYRWERELGTRVGDWTTTMFGALGHAPDVDRVVIARRVKPKRQWRAVSEWFDSEPWMFGVDVVHPDFGGKPMHAEWRDSDD